MKEKIEWYREVLELEPNSKVFFPLAKMLAEEGEIKQSIDVLEKGLERHPEYLEARLFLIELLFSSNHREACATQINHLSAMFASYAGFWQAWAACLAQEPEEKDTASILRFLAANFISGPLKLHDVINKGLAAIQEEKKNRDSAVKMTVREDIVERQDKAEEFPDATGEISQTISVESDIEGLADIQEDSSSSTVDEGDALRINEPVQEKGGVIGETVVLAQENLNASQGEAMEELTNFGDDSSEAEYVVQNGLEQEISCAADKKEQSITDENPAEEELSFAGEILSDTVPKDIEAPDEATDLTVDMAGLADSEVKNSDSHAPEFSQDIISVKKIDEQEMPDEEAALEEFSSCEEDALKNESMLNEKAKSEQEDMERQVTESQLSTEKGAQQDNLRNIQDDSMLEPEKFDPAASLEENVAGILQDAMKDESFTNLLKTEELETIDIPDVPDLMVEKSPLEQTSGQKSHPETEEEAFDALIDTLADQSLELNESGDKAEEQIPNDEGSLYNAFLKADDEFELDEIFNDDVNDKTENAINIPNENKREKAANAQPESQEEKFSLRTKSMADVLAAQGDIQGALDIYEELEAAALDPEEAENIRARISTLQERLSEAENSNMSAMQDADKQDSKKLIGLLETLAKRVEARVAN